MVEFYLAVQVRHFVFMYVCLKVIILFGSKSEKYLVLSLQAECVRKRQYGYVESAALLAASGRRQKSKTMFTLYRFGKNWNTDD